MATRGWVRSEVLSQLQQRSDEMHPLGNVIGDAGWGMQREHVHAGRNPRYQPRNTVLDDRTVPGLFTEMFGGE